MNSDKEPQKEKGRKATFRISLQITAVVLVIFLAASLICLFLYQKALGDMADNSKDKVIESTVDVIESSHQFVAQLIMFLQVMRGDATSLGQLKQGLRQAVAEGKETPVQKNTNDLLKAMIDGDFLEFTLGYFAIPPTPENDKAVVSASSNKEYIGDEVPKEVAALIDSEDGYRVFDNGVPELGLEGKYLVTAFRVTGGGLGMGAVTSTTGGAPADEIWYFDFKPVGKLLSGIDDFYNTENRNAILTLCLAIGLSMIILVIISFSVLGYQIKKRISGPIDELSAAAEKVIEGDMDVRLEIKKREEFSALKSAFNHMISTLSEIISRSLGEQREADSEELDDEGGAGRSYLKPRSNLLIRVIALFTIVFIFAGASYIITINRSMNSLIEKSKETQINAVGELITAGHKFGNELAQMLASATMGNMYDQELIKQFLASVPGKTVSAFQKQTGDMFKLMVAGQLFGYTDIILMIPPSPITEDYTIVVASNDKYIYKTPPEEISRFYDIEGNGFVFFEDGIPEMGLEGPYLATCYKMPTPLSALEPVVVDFKPMGEEVKAIDEFFSDETTRLMITMVIVIGVSILLLIFITALTMTYLIRKQITGPIEELVHVADEVMDGNLDVQVQIRPGEKLESLKTAFNEMIKTLRDIIERSIEG